jgi:hypothetical protein
MSDRPSVAPLAAHRWYFERVRDHAEWNFAFLFSGPAGVDVRQVERCAARLQANHESLRSAFALRDGELVLEVRPDAPTRVREHRLPPSDAARHHVADLVEELRALASPLDTALHSVHVLRDVAPGSDAVLFFFHHLVCDLQSVRIYLRRFFSELSGAGPAGGTAHAPGRFVQVCRRRALKAEALLGERDALKRLFDDGSRRTRIPPERLATGRNLRIDDSVAAHVFSVQTTRALRRAASADLRCGFIDLLAWACTAALSERLGSAATRLFVIDSGRAEPEVTELGAMGEIGWLSTLLMFDLAVDAASSTAAQIVDVARQRMQAPHGGRWHEHLSHAGHGEDFHVDDLQRIVLNFSGVTTDLVGPSGAGWTLQGDLVAPPASSVNGRNCLFYIEASIDADALAVRWHTNHRVVDERVFDALLARFVHLLETCASRVETRPAGATP